MFVQRIIYPSASSPNVGPTHCLLDYTWSKYSSDLLSTRPTTGANSCPTRYLRGGSSSNALSARPFHVQMFVQSVIYQTPSIPNVLSARSFYLPDRFYCKCWSHTFSIKSLLAKMLIQYLIY
ncbi:hypothetical protein CEXT_773091 [Caerostris extrusa]|uniref:Uncharacterized protein n=1 Tax=Caerostris extrusa TaxID=172846 RepID=A0AAV4QW53_CAEEX|nr:hypothetical protein CEXT_773091 [Caerostris extrusa]